MCQPETTTTNKASKNAATPALGIEYEARTDLAHEVIVVRGPSALGKVNGSKERRKSFALMPHTVSFALHSMFEQFI